MKYPFCFLFFLIVGNSTFVKAQIHEKGSVYGLVNLERHQFKIDLMSPGFSYEIGLFKNQSVSGGVGLGVATYIEGYAFGLATNTRYRYYHNFNRRIKKGKNVSGNSGNYIAAAQAIFFGQLRIATTIEGPSDYNLGFYGFVYGIQRTYNSGFNFNAEVGGGLYKGDGVADGYGPLVHFTFGWVATKRKARKPVFK